MKRNLESSGVPHTVYKGNHKKYTKECLIIFDKETGAITLEKLNHNIQVKKTRSEMTNKPSLMPAANANAAIPPSANGLPLPSMAAVAGAGVGGGVAVGGGGGSGPGPKLENSTMRITSKTKVSTGSRRNNIIDYKPRNSPMQQSSPSRPVAQHRSPQSAPAWHANNAQQTLPSIPMITDDDDFGMSAALHNGGHANMSSGAAAGQADYMSNHMGKQRQAAGSQAHAKRQQMSQRSSPPNQQQQQHQQNYSRGNNYAQQQQQQQQQQQRASFSNHSNHNSNSNSMPLDLDSPSHHHELSSSQSVAHAAAVLEQQIGGALSASSSSSESDSSDSDSGSDSDDSTEDDRPTQQQQSHHLQQQQAQQHQQQLQQQQHMNQLPNLGLGSISPAYSSHQQQQSHHQHHQQQQQQHHQQQQQQQQSGIYAPNGGFPNDLLQNDLQLSSNSSDDDD